MSFERFIELMQMLLTMVDPEDENSIAQVRTILDELHKLALSSGKIIYITHVAMCNAREQLPQLIETRESFAGTPGDFRGNKHKRDRLGQILAIHC